MGRMKALTLPDESGFPEDDRLVCEWCHEPIDERADCRSARGGDIICGDCKEVDNA